MSAQGVGAFGDRGRVLKEGSLIMCGTRGRIGCAVGVFDWKGHQNAGGWFAPNVQVKCFLLLEICITKIKQN